MRIGPQPEHLVLLKLERFLTHICSGVLLPRTTNKGGLNKTFDNMYIYQGFLTIESTLSDVHLL